MQGLVRTPVMRRRENPLMQRNLSAELENRFYRQGVNFAGHTTSHTPQEGFTPPPPHHCHYSVQHRNNSKTHFDSNGLHKEITFDLSQETAHSQSGSCLMAALLNDRKHCVTAYDLPTTSWPSKTFLYVCSFSFGRICRVLQAEWRMKTLWFLPTVICLILPQRA